MKEIIVKLKDGQMFYGLWNGKVYRSREGEDMIRIYLNNKEINCTERDIYFSEKENVKFLYRLLNLLYLRDRYKSNEISELKKYLKFTVFNIDIDNITYKDLYNYIIKNLDLNKYDDIKTIFLKFEKERMEK